jgi:hypothetical protein
MAPGPAPAPCCSTTTDRPLPSSARARASESELYDLFLRPMRHRGPARDVLGVPARRCERGVRHTRRADRSQHRPADPGIPSPALARPCLRPHAAMSRPAVGYRPAGSHARRPRAQFRGLDDGQRPGPASGAEFLRPAPPRSTSISTLLDGRKRALLIDSGWQGTTQSLLTAAASRHQWRGLYFGRILTPAHDRRIVQDCIGLMFEAEHWDPDRPETAFVRHRHLIEALLEPRAPRSRMCAADPRKTPSKPRSHPCAPPPDPDDRQLYLAVRRYVTDNAGQSPARILAAHSAAMPELARMIVRPRRRRGWCLPGKGRSADFGKSLVVPVIRPIRAKPWPRDRETRIDMRSGPRVRSRSNTRPLRPGVAGPGQRQHDGDPSRCPADKPWTRRSSEGRAETPRVAVITRTKNRPVLLRRAAQSVGEPDASATSSGRRQ